jgi:hypothetical protein
MKEKPIIFSTLMVQAILAGKKTQTRRVIKPQPDSRGLRTTNVMYEDLHGREIKFSYGQIGDILWVRETWFYAEGYFIYKADCHENYEINKWKPSIFMPKEACRIRLKIINIRVEKLQNISESDASAEGLQDYYGKRTPYSSNIIRYSDLWEEINGKDSWLLNPWVWVIEFKRFNQ